MAEKNQRPQYKVKRRLNVALYKIKAGDVLPVRLSGEMRKQSLGDKDKEDATILRATHLDSGELIDIIAPTVLLSTLQREYPDGFANKAVLIECSGKREGKRYNDVFVSELDA